MPLRPLVDWMAPAEEPAVCSTGDGVWRHIEDFRKLLAVELLRWGIGVHFGRQDLSVDNSCRYSADRFERADALPFCLPVFRQFMRSTENCNNLFRLDSAESDHS